jgi:hypothetical protein
MIVIIRTLIVCLNLVPLNCITGILYMPESETFWMEIKRVIFVPVAVSSRQFHFTESRQSSSRRPPHRVGAADMGSGNGAPRVADRRRDSWEITKPPPNYSPHFLACETLPDRAPAQASG